MLSAILVASLGILAACGGSSQPVADIHPGAGQHLAGMPGSTGASSTAGSMPTMPAMPTSPAAGSAATQRQTSAVGVNTVTIQNFAFAPAALTVKVGTTVTWINQDSDAHTVTSQHQGPLKSAALSTGNRYSYTFTKPGSYSYLCTIHPFMTATVTVTG
jgi:plastocyanin